jgi:hypothetical protein
MRRLFFGTVALSLLSNVLSAECTSAQDHRTDKKRGIIVASVVLEGTRSIDSSEMSSIVAELSGSCFDDHDDTVTAYIRQEFRQRGYMTAKVEHVQIDTGDSLAVPKPATIKADVTEGPLYHIGELRFDGNSAFSSDQLTAGFPLKTGDIFTSTRVLSGFNALRNMYSSAGYIDVVFVPEFQMQSAQADKPEALVQIHLKEGQQYHMGKLQVFGPEEQSEALQRRWTLAAGAPFDASYPRKFLQDNRDALPQGFVEQQGLRTLRDCREATVTVALILDWRDAVNQNLTEFGCEKPKTAEKTDKGPQD